MLSVNIVMFMCREMFSFKKKKKIGPHEGELPPLGSRKVGKLHHVGVFSQSVACCTK